MVDRGLTVLGLAGTILFGVLPFMGAKIPKKWAWTGFGISAALLFIGVAMLLMPAVAQQGAPTINGNCNANGNNNTYSNNNCSTTLNQTPKPEIRIVSQDRQRAGAGRIIDTIVFEIVSAFVVPRVTVVAHAPDLLSMQISMAASPSSPGIVSGLMSGVFRGGANGVYKESWANVSGRYQMVLTKSGESQTGLDWSLE